MNYFKGLHEHTELQVQQVTPMQRGIEKPLSHCSFNAANFCMKRAQIINATLRP